MNIKNKFGSHTISILMAIIFIPLSLIQFNMYREKESELESCISEKHDLEVRVEELETNLEDCRDKNEKCIKMVTYLMARNSSLEDDIILSEYY